MGVFVKSVTLCCHCIIAGIAGTIGVFSCMVAWEFILIQSVPQIPYQTRLDMFMVREDSDKIVRDLIHHDATGRFNFCCVVT